MKVSDYLGRILFPQLRQWERRKYARILLLALFIIFVVSLFVLVAVREEMANRKLNPEPQINFQPPVSS